MGHGHTIGQMNSGRSYADESVEIGEEHYQYLDSEQDK